MKEGSISIDHHLSLEKYYIYIKTSTTTFTCYVIENCPFLSKSRTYHGAKFNVGLIFSHLLFLPNSFGCPFKG